MSQSNSFLFEDKSDFINLNDFNDFFESYT